MLSSDTVDSVAAKVLALLGRFGLPRGLPRGALAFIFVELRARFLVGGSGSRGDKPDLLPIEDERLLLLIFFGLGRCLPLTGLRLLTGERGLGEMDRGDKSSSRGESFFGFFFRRLPTFSSSERPDFGEIRPPLLLSLTVLVLLLDASWLLSISMLPLIFLLDDMMPLVFLSFVGLLLFKLVRGDTPPSRSGTGPVLENLLLTEDLGDIILIVLDLFPVGRLGFPALLPGRLGRPRLPVMPGIDMVRFIATRSRAPGAGILHEGLVGTNV